MAQSVSFTVPTDYSVEQQALQRRRKMAEMLQAQSLQPLETNRMAGGYVVPVSPFEGMAKMAQAYVGKQSAKKADEEEKTMAANRQKAMIDTLIQADQIRQGAPAIDAPPEELGGGPGRPAMPGNQQAALARVLSNPDLAPMGAQALVAQLMPKAPIKARPGDVFVDPNNPSQTMGSVPLAPNWQIKEIPQPNGGVKVVQVDMNSPDPMSTAREVSQRGARAEVLPSGQAINPYEVQPGQVFNDPNKLMNIGPDGRAVVNQPLVDVRGQIAERGASRTNVSVNTDKTMFSGAAGEVGKSLANAADVARGAVGTINTAGQILEALDSGKVIAGPGTTARQWLGQVGQTLGIAGKDATDQLVQTRKVIQGLAQLELDAAQQMKGQGQITEAERGIIRRAASGEIDSITQQELRMLMGGLDKVARFKISTNQKNVELLSRQPGAGALPQFMDVPMPPAYQPRQQQPNVPPPPPGFQVVR